VKLIGYIIAFVGIIGLAATTFPSLLAELPFLAAYSITNITLASAALIIVGILLAARSKHKIKGLSGAEVPIFDGDVIIGYRKR
jgi:intracellular septation protein A